jgi:hypothetical protein
MVLAARYSAADDAPAGRGGGPLLTGASSMAAVRGQEGLTCGVLRRAFPCQRRFSSPSAWWRERRAAPAPDDLAQTLYALRESVPDPADRMRIADTLASLQAARSAMDAGRAPGGAGPWQAETVRGRLDAFESSLHALRADDQRYP